MKRYFVQLALLSLAATSAAGAQAASIEGQWRNPKDSVVVTVAPCGTGIWCGTVSRASDKFKAGARQGGTANVIGARLLTGLKPDGNGGYKGRAYIPKYRVHATATVRAAGANTMIVKGCALAGLACKEQRWTRVN